MSYWDRIGQSFIDIEEDITFTVVDVCKCTCSSSYFFKYRVPDDESDDDETEYHHSALQHVMKDGWAQWVVDDH